MGPTADVHLDGGHTKDNPTKIHFSNMNRLLKNLATIHTTYKKIGARYLAKQMHFYSYYHG
jgi:hypothetical protein